MTLEEDVKIKEDTSSNEEKVKADSEAKAESRRRVFRLEKKARKKRHDISLRAFITIMIILVCAIILWVYIKLSADNYTDRYKTEMYDKLAFQSEVLAAELVNNNFLVEGELDLNEKIDTISGLFDGRVMVVDSDYKVVKDSYVSRQGSYIINGDIISAIDGGRIVSEDKGDYLEYIYPIKDGNKCYGAVVMVASTEMLKSITNQMSGRNIIMYVVIMIFCVGAAVAIGYASVRGITYINRQIEFTGEGNFNTRIPEKGFKEFRRMTEKYNATLNKLMVIDSTRQEFVSNVSHELKTPITSMKVLADSLVENEQADLPMYKEFMSDIVDEIDRETKIINDLLTLVKMDKKSAKLNVAELDINGLLEVILKRVTPIAQSRGIVINYEGYRDVIAEVDEVKLSLAFNNIIENAVKYNVDNGWVKVTLNADHKYFYVKVADSGVGIPDDCKDQVFERFYRVDKARSRDTGGTGLGLAITREAVHMHKGSIKLYSESGQGTTFTIKIPIKFADV